MRRARQSLRRKSLETWTDGGRRLQESRGASIGRRTGRVITPVCGFDIPLGDLLAGP